MERSQNIVRAAAILSLFFIAVIPTLWNTFEDTLNGQLAQVGGGGNTYYVSTSGDDANPGTLDQPWKTLERALDLGRPFGGGDTVYIRGGIYRFDETKMGTRGEGQLDVNQINGTANRPTVIAGYPGERPIFYLSDRMDQGWEKYDRPGAEIWFLSWNDYIEDNHPWTYRNSKNTSGSRSWKFVPQLVALDGNSPRLLQEVNSAKNAIYAPGGAVASVRSSQDNMIAGDFYYESDEGSPNYGRLFVWLPDGSEPNGKPLEVSRNIHIGLSYQRYVSVSNITARYSQMYSLSLNGDHNIFDNVDFSYNSLAGANGSECDSCTVKNSSFSYNGQQGSSLYGNNTLYENNLFDHNNYRLYSAGWHCGGIKVIPNKTGMIFRKNTFKDTYSCPGLWFDYVKGGHIIEQNRFIKERGPHPDLMVEISDATADQPIIVRNNIFENGNVYISGSDYVYVYNNLLHNAGISIFGIGGDRLDASNNKIFNNIFYVPFGSNSSNVPIYIILDPPAPYTAVNNISDYNIFLAPPGINTLFGGDFNWQANITPDQWVAKGFDTHSKFIELQGADPLLRNPSARDFMLKTDGLAVDGGMNIGAVTNDIQGNSRPQDGDGDGTATSDVGPYELAGIPVQTPPPEEPMTDADQISNIVVRSVTQDTAVIQWSTDESADSQVEYGLTTAYGNVTAYESALVLAHRQTLTGLLPDTAYHFRVKSKDSVNQMIISSDQTFVTLPETDLPLPPVENPLDEILPPPITNPTLNYLSNFPNQRKSTTIKFTPTRKPDFVTLNLKMGDKNEEVRLLQITLNALGFAVATSGPGSPGQEITLFNAQTKVALTAYQTARQLQGLEASGRVDNVTILFINNDIERLQEAQEKEIENQQPSEPPRRSFLSTFFSRIYSGFMAFINRIFK